MEAGGQPGDDGRGQLVLPHEQPLVRPRRADATGEEVITKVLLTCGKELINVKSKTLFTTWQIICLMSPFS